MIPDLLHAEPAAGRAEDAVQEVHGLAADVLDTPGLQQLPDAPAVDEHEPLIAIPGPVVWGFPWIQTKACVHVE